MDQLLSCIENNSLTNWIMAVCTVGILYFAYLGANYTKKIWQKDELKRCFEIIYEEHNKNFKYIFETLDMGYIPFEGDTIFNEVNCYYKYLPKKELNLSLFEVTLDVLIQLADESIKDECKKLKTYLNNVDCYYRGFLYEVENINPDHSQYVILVAQAKAILDNLKEEKLKYLVYYEQVKAHLIKTIYKI